MQWYSPNFIAFQDIPLAGNIYFFQWDIFYTAQPEKHPSSDALFPQNDRAVSNMEGATPNENTDKKNIILEPGGIYARRNDFDRVHPFGICFDLQRIFFL
jgi:hypothetical protein